MSEYQRIVFVFVKGVFLFGAAVFAAATVAAILDVLFVIGWGFETRSIALGFVGAAGAALGYFMVSFIQSLITPNPN